MRNLLITTLLLAITFIFTRCSSTGCAIEETAAAGTASGIAAALQCDDEPQIQSDIKGLLDKTGMCKMSGIVGATVCPALANAIVSELANLPPSKWKCHPANAQASLSALAMTACQAIPF